MQSAQDKVTKLGCYVIARNDRAVRSDQLHPPHLPRCCFFKQARPDPCRPSAPSHLSRRACVTSQPFTQLPPTKRDRRRLSAASGGVGKHVCATADATPHALASYPTAVDVKVQPPSAKPAFHCGRFYFPICGHAMWLEKLAGGTEWLRAVIPVV